MSPGQGTGKLWLRLGRVSEVDAEHATGLRTVGPVGHLCGLRSLFLGFPQRVHSDCQYGIKAQSHTIYGLP